MRIMPKDNKVQNDSSTQDQTQDMPETYVNDFMQEINDYIINGLHYGLFASKKYTRHDADLYKKIRQMNELVTLDDLELPKQMQSQVNLEMYNKAVKEL